MPCKAVEELLRALEERKILRSTELALEDGGDKQKMDKREKSLNMVYYLKKSR